MKREQDVAAQDASDASARPLRRLLPYWLPAALLFALAAAVHPGDAGVAAAVRDAKGTEAGATMVQAVSVVQPFGKTDVAALIALLAGATGWPRLGRRALVAVLVIVPAVVLPLKFAVGRERPNRHDHVSFPSGDSATAAALGATIAAEGAGLVVPVAVGVAVLVGAGRVATQSHYPSDVLSGLAFGLLAAGVARELARRGRLPRISSGAFRILLAVFLVGYPSVCAAVGFRGDLVNFLRLYAPAVLLLLAARWLRFPSARPDPGEPAPDPEKAARDPVRRTPAVDVVVEARS